MERGHNEEEERMRDLYDASRKGCVSDLNTLLQQDPLMLHRVSSCPTLNETPLHISALLGHLEFTKTLLHHCPKLALELDSLRRTPLHLASAEGHVDIVKELLRDSADHACLVGDQEHRIPLHYAVIRGRKDVVLELVRRKPESLRFHDDRGRNVFHLCVMHNQLDILKALVALDTHDTNKLLTEGDLDGKNTVLHLAIMLKQVETVSCLISIPKVRSEATELKNNVGHSAADIVEQIPRDCKSLEIQAILMEWGIKFGKKISVGAREEEDRSGNSKWWSMRNVVAWMKQWIHGDGEWVQQMRANLSLVPTIVATITFQAAINPPGGVVQQNIRSPDLGNNSDTSFKTLKEGPLGCSPYRTSNGYNDEICPGQALLAYKYPISFGKFMIYNDIAFVSSLVVAFLLLSGIPLKSKSMMWALILGMISNLTFLLNAYFISLYLISPYVTDDDKIVTKTSWIINGCLGFIALCIVVTRVTAKISKKRNTRGSSATGMETSQSVTTAC
ncbi:protein ACCELERATED CELL DEATH 6-like [Prosopis cineraria]|uniref:protein ACCELERATED CELL DEATH 6-like n=1 Tax=Prosopis cineraria TaxID=364024 RepID=UPI00240FA922|nr:protein ACCELERATED CELL DEATH 6-like [Prosopis cineraria]